MDENKYGKLLAEHRPRLIETPEEHERLLTLAETLMEKGDGLAAEEEQLLALIVLLVEAYETHGSEEDDDEAESPQAAPSPHDTLRRLMTSKGIELHDIADIFGNPHIAREVFEGQRPISRSQARQLAKFFRVPEKLFREN